MVKRLKFVLWAVGILASLWGQPAAPSLAQDPNPAVVKLFEETTYYLKDVTLVDPNTGWAVGDVHWDQSQRAYRGTIVKTTDGGKTWLPQNVGVAQKLNKITFLDARTGWAVGANGTIVHTTDGGETWTQQPVPTQDEFSAVSFADAQNGWAVATVPTTYDDFFKGYIDWNASIWHTSSGGQTWEQQSIPAGASVLHGVDFVDALNGWAVGSKRSGEATPAEVPHAGMIYHTADGGITWTEQYSPRPDLSLSAVDFVDALNGWVVGFPTNSGGDQRAVFHTTDGGITWETQEPGDIFGPLWDVQFVDQNRGYAVGADYASAWGPPVYRTLDAGKTWEKIRMAEANPISVEGIYGVAVAGDTVVAVGDHDYVSRTEQGWGSQAQDTQGLPCYDNSCLFKQFYINPHYIFHDVFFTDDQHGWVVGSKTFSVSSWGQVILATQDGGLTWTTQYEHAPNLDDLFNIHRLDAIQFTDSRNGWAVGKAAMFSGTMGWNFEGAILHTTDGGQTWQEAAGSVYDERDREFFAVHFADAMNGWALAADYFPSTNVNLAHTTDGGQTWKMVDTQVNGSLAVGFMFVQGDVTFPDAQHGWAVGGQGTVVYTGDGGNTWTPQTLNCGYPSCPIRLYAAAMLDTQNGWIAGENLYHTTDGGQTWMPQTIDKPGDIQDLQFVDPQHGWLAGDEGMLKRTADGGQSWETVETGTGARLLGLYFTGPDRGWMVGEYGTILGYGMLGSALPAASTPAPAFTGPTATPLAPAPTAALPAVTPTTAALPADPNVCIVTPPFYPVAAFDRPDPNTATAPKIINEGSLELVAQMPPSEDGTVWYQVKDQTWVMNYMIFLPPAPVPPACQNLPVVGQGVLPAPTSTPAAAAGACVINLSQPAPFFDSPVMGQSVPEIRENGGNVQFDGQYVDTVGLTWFHAADGQWSMKDFLWPGLSVPPECARLPTVTP